jgi:hypothetical protein
MQYVEYIRLAVIVLGFIRELRSGTDQNDALAGLLQKVSEAFVPTLGKSEDFKLIAPEIAALIAALHGLRDETK